MGLVILGVALFVTIVTLTPLRDIVKKPMDYLIIGGYYLMNTTTLLIVLLTYSEVNEISFGLWLGYSILFSYKIREKVMARGM